MTFRVKRRPKVVTTKLQTDETFKIVAIPRKFPRGYIWITGMAVSKSDRALNDWMKRRNKRKNVIKLNTVPPKKRNYKTFWWFEKHENIPWVISEEYKSFFFYKKRS